MSELTDVLEQAVAKIKEFEGAVEASEQTVADASAKQGELVARESAVQAKEAEIAQAKEDADARVQAAEKAEADLKASQEAVAAREASADQKEQELAQKEANLNDKEASLGQREEAAPSVALPDELVKAQEQLATDQKALQDFAQQLANDRADIEADKEAIAAGKQENDDTKAKLQQIQEELDKQQG